MKSRAEGKPYQLKNKQDTVTKESHCCAYAIVKIGLHQSQKAQVPRGGQLAHFSYQFELSVIHSLSPRFQPTPYTYTIH